MVAFGAFSTGCYFNIAVAGSAVWSTSNLNALIYPPYLGARFAAGPLSRFLISVGGLHLLAATQLAFAILAICVHLRFLSAIRQLEG
eukprot:NODE_16820_length_975_cov_5.792453.p4 GENE.NODE_16820_length_975_cov_5.792453~~NODE_16820_length_975_cov_5.792453.p4  ORF type:complete len:87 (+),score=14.60 NODE_16820_length_975_cov_5.792453:634-894(+)